MKNELQVLDKNIREKRPEYYAKLQDPLTARQIADLELKYKITLPNDVKQLYLWKNGQQYDNYAAFANNSMFEPLENVLNSGQELTGMIGYEFLFENWWNPSWLPLFSNGGGAYICYDREGTFTGVKGQILEYWNSDNDRNVIAPDLPTFLKVLNTYYQETEVADFDAYFSISERLVPYEKSFIVDKPIPKKY